MPIFATDNISALSIYSDKQFIIIIMSRLKIAVVLALPLMAAGLASCFPEPSTQHDINISSFYFRSCDTAPDINSITFTVDTVSLTISNSDSVAYTSSLTKVLPVITCYSTPSAIYVNGSKWNQKDTLDLSSQPTTITIVGSDKSTSCDYVLTINKHQVDPDSIIWTRTGDSFFDFTDAADVYGLQSDHTFYISVKKSSGGGTMYSTTNGNDWNKIADYEDNISIRTMNIRKTASDSKGGCLYAISEDNTTVYGWNDGAGAWESQYEAGEGIKLLDISGSANGTLSVLCSDNNTGQRKFLFFDGSEWKMSETPVDAAIPVYGAAKTYITGVPYLIGGETGNGDFSGNVMSSEDGYYWINLLNQGSDNNFGKLSEGAVFLLDGEIFILGGKTADGVNDALFCSYDNGYSWQKVDSNQAMSAEYGKRHGACAFSSEDENIWIIGGFDENGNLMQDIWRGRMNKSDFIIR